MSKIREHKYVIILVIVFIAFISFFAIREYRASKTIYIESSFRDEDYVMSPKTYNVNDYSLVNITDEQMANIYLTDFKYYLATNIDYAYSLLNEEYRNIKFGSIDNFRNYVYNISFVNMFVKRYSIENGKNEIYTAYTNDDNMYIFKIKSVMEYEVYLDDYTVEI